MAGASAAALARRSDSGSCAVAFEARSERLGLAVLRDVRGGGVDDLERSCLALVGGVCPMR